MDKKRKGVWISSFGDRWVVGVGGGYYNRPVDRAEAIKHARQIAKALASRSGRPIGTEVLAENGELIEQIV